MARSEDMESAVLLYLARLVSPIWGLKLKRVETCIYPYLADITMRIL